MTFAIPFPEPPANTLATKVAVNHNTPLLMTMNKQMRVSESRMSDSK